jgi:PleD family two-component response regulator
MKADAMATRMSVLTRAMPLRILVVDDDELVLTLMADRLAAAGFDVVRAANGEEALALLSRQWMPLVITDWQMPVMDGIAFTEQLRARGIEDTYVIMLTMRESSLDYERGYYAGVDDYVTKKLPDAELFARIHTGFNTLALRRSLQETRAELLQANPIDAESGAFSPRETLTRLRSEIRRAQRYGRMLSVMTVGVHITTLPDANPQVVLNLLDEPAAAPQPVTTSAALAAVVKALQSVVRTHIDWVGRLESAPGTTVFAVVLPEAAIPDGPTIKERLRSALDKLPAGGYDGQALAFGFGLASLERGGRDGKPVEPADLLSVAEQCRGCSGHAGAAQLSAVQRSVSIGATIACRHGYAVVSHCSFKSAQPLMEDRRESQVAPGAS